MRSLFIRFSPFLLIGALAACGGGSPASLPQATSGNAATQTVTASTTGTTAIPAVFISAGSATATLPQANVAASVTETVSSSAPSGVTPLDIARSAAGSKRAPLAAAAQTVILYLGFTTTTSVSFAGTVGVNFTLPSLTAGATYDLALYDDATGTWTVPFAGPGTTSGTTVSFPISTSGTMTEISPNEPLYVALYDTVGGASPSPSPSPSPAPVVAAPTSLTFQDGSSPSQTFSVTETGYSGSFTAQSSVPAVATVAAGSTAGTFTVTPLESGNTTITITGASGATAATVAVTVGAPITVDSTTRSGH